ncbi:MAG: response regulator [Betaproteobacteria bacterium]|jgi:CheY-like chemotaxis protein|nr:response regulator [Betaproteobacteria bacterium]
MSKPGSPEDELDFTHPGTAPAPAITPQQVERVRKEATTGGQQLEATGYFVSIARRPEARIPPRHGNKYVVLAVEDDADLGQLLIDIFTLSGFEVRWASNRAEINAELNRKPEADVILMDIILPDANGLEVLQRLRSHPRLGKLPVIMMTGKSGPEDVLAGLAAGADGYVSKPFKMSGLVKAVNTVLGNN